MLVLETSVTTRAVLRLLSVLHEALTVSARCFQGPQESMLSEDSTGKLSAILKDAAPGIINALSLYCITFKKLNGKINSMLQTHNQNYHLVDNFN